MYWHDHVGIACLVVLSLAGSLALAGHQPAVSQDAPLPAARPPDRPEAIVLSAIRANPVTAPYAIATAWKNGAVVLSGRVGTSLIHDMAVRTAIDLGYPVRDDLVIDTAEAHRVALAQTYAGGWPGSGAAYAAQAGSAPYFVYPPPLFGRVDDPFFGFEPPLASFPPWWRSQNLDPSAALPGTSAAGPGWPGPGPGASPGAGIGARPPVPAATPPVKGNLQLTVDMAGQVFLSGVVASDEDRQIIEAEARNTPGVSRVISELLVAAPTSEAPPPPPQPILRPEPEIRPAPPAPEVTQKPPVPGPVKDPRPRPDAQARQPVAADLAIARDSQKLTRRVAEALGKRPPLAGLPIAVQSRGDVVTLSGKVPSVYEAMLAYRTVEQIPGVRELVDQLQFQVPDENHPNPLCQKGRPEDLEPYLTSQIRRHVGDLAHVDRVRVRGDVVEVRGTVLDARDQNRVQAILRSMPLLRDFRLEPTLVAE